MAEKNKGRFDAVPVKRESNQRRAKTLPLSGTFSADSGPPAFAKRKVVFSALFIEGDDANLCIR